MSTSLEPVNTLLTGKKDLADVVKLGSSAAGIAWTIWVSQSKHISDRGRRPDPKECGQPLEAGKDKDTDSPLELPGRSPPLQTPKK